MTLRKTSATSRRSRSLSLESLESRETPAAQAFFSAGLLSVVGDSSANNLLVSADAAGQVRVTDSGAAIAIQGQPATLAQLKQVNVDAGAGNDTTTLDRSLNTGT